MLRFSILCTFLIILSSCDKRYETFQGCVLDKNKDKHLINIPAIIECNAVCKVEYSADDYAKALHPAKALDCNQKSFFPF